MCTSSAVCSSIKMFWICRSPRPKIYPTVEQLKSDSIFVTELWNMSESLCRQGDKFKHLHLDLWPTSLSLCTQRTYRRRCHTAGVGQSFLHPHGRIQESFHAEIPKHWPEVLTNLSVTLQLPIKAQSLSLLRGDDGTSGIRFYLYRHLSSRRHSHHLSTIIFLRQAKLVQSWGLKRLWAPLLGSTRNSPMGTVPEHHSKTPLRCENGTTWESRHGWRQTGPVEVSGVKRFWKDHSDDGASLPCIVWCWASSYGCLRFAAATWSTCWRPAASPRPDAGRPDPVHDRKTQWLHYLLSYYWVLFGFVLCFGFVEQGVFFLIPVFNLVADVKSESTGKKTCRSQWKGFKEVNH